MPSRPVSQRQEPQSSARAAAKTCQAAALSLLLLAQGSALAWGVQPHTTPGAAQPPAAAPGKAPAAAPTDAPRVDINSATREQLKTLPGIGDAEAARIIAARPYPSKAKLVAENVLSFDHYTELKHRIVAAQKLPPRHAGASKTRQDTAQAKPARPS